MKYLLLPLMLIACGDKEVEDTSKEEVEETQEEQEESEDTSSEAAE